jgi:hypothetical protein
LTPLLRAIEIGSATIVQLLLIKGVEMDYNCRVVSESNYIWMNKCWVDG